MSASVFNSSKNPFFALVSSASQALGAYEDEFVIYNDYEFNFKMSSFYDEFETAEKAENILNIYYIKLINYISCEDNDIFKLLKDNSEHAKHYKHIYKYLKTVMKHKLNNYSSCILLTCGEFPTPQQNQNIKTFIKNFINNLSFNQIFKHLKNIILYNFDLQTYLKHELINNDNDLNKMIIEYLFNYDSNLINEFINNYMNVILNNEYIINKNMILINNILYKDKYEITIKINDTNFILNEFETYLKDLKINKYYIQFMREYCFKNGSIIEKLLNYKMIKNLNDDSLILYQYYKNDKNKIINLYVYYYLYNELFINSTSSKYLKMLIDEYILKYEFNFKTYINDLILHYDYFKEIQATKINTYNNIIKNINQFYKNNFDDVEGLENIKNILKHIYEFNEIENINNYDDLKIYIINNYDYDKYINIYNDYDEYEIYKMNFKLSSLKLKHINNLYYNFKNELIKNNIDFYEVLHTFKAIYIKNYFDNDTLIFIYISEILKNTFEEYENIINDYKILIEFNNNDDDELIINNVINNLILYDKNINISDLNQLKKNIKKINKYYLNKFDDLNIIEKIFKFMINNYNELTFKNKNNDDYETYLKDVEIKIYNIIYIILYNKLILNNKYYDLNETLIKKYNILYKILNDFNKLNDVILKSYNLKYNNDYYKKLNIINKFITYIKIYNNIYELNINKYILNEYLNNIIYIIIYNNVYNNTKLNNLINYTYENINKNLLFDINFINVASSGLYKNKYKLNKIYDSLLNLLFNHYDILKYNSEDENIIKYINILLQFNKNHPEFNINKIIKIIFEYEKKYSYDRIKNLYDYETTKETQED